MFKPTDANLSHVIAAENRAIRQDLRKREKAQRLQTIGEIAFLALEIAVIIASPVLIFGTSLTTLLVSGAIALFLGFSVTNALLQVKKSMV